jgi:undecaprenyl-diphosphatase
VDPQLLFLINREWTSPALDRAMAALSSFEVWMPLLALLAVVLAFYGGFRVRAFLVTVAVVVGLNDGVVSASLKRLVDRPRPHESHAEVRRVELERARPRLLAVWQPARVKMSRLTFQDVNGRSFPSSHTMNTISAALVAACFFGRRVWWGFLLAGLVAYSRIYTGSHWPSDVLTSIFLGLGATLLWLALLEWLWRARGKIVLPRVWAEHPSLLAAGAK